MIKRCIEILFLVSLYGIELSSQSTAHWPVEKSNWLGQQKKMYLMKSEEVDRLLPCLHNYFPDFEERLRALSILRLDTPYDIKAIGDGAGYEPNPVFTVEKTNCTVQVLTNAALAHARSYAEAESLMAFINYYPVKPGQNPFRYENRRHYTSDRILTCQYYQELSSRIAKSCELDTIRMILNLRKDGQHFLPLDWEKKVSMPYLPKKAITEEFLDRLPAVCGVGIIRKQLFDKGIIIAHEGMIFDGTTFVHASSRARKVIAENFLHYCSSDQKLYGIVLYLFKEVK